MPKTANSQNAPAPPNAASKTGNVSATIKFYPQLQSAATLMAEPRILSG